MLFADENPNWSVRPVAPQACNSAMNTHVVSAVACEGMVTAVEKVRQRLRRAAQALEQARIPYALAGERDRRLGQRGG